MEVSIPSIAYDPATRTIDVDVRAEFVGSLSGDIRINCWIVEDGVTGSGNDQVNFYDTQSGHPYFGAGNPIVGFVHDRVARAMLGVPGAPRG